MTDKQIENGFWYYDHKDNFPPNSLSKIEDYKGEDYLSIAINNDKELKEWIQFIPTLVKVKFLWIHSNVNQLFFDTICNMTNLIGLNINITTVKDIDNLTKLEKLEYLKIGNCSKIENILPLGILKNLKVLEIENAKKISDFKIIEQLTNLQGLSICGSMWATQKIDTLKPFSNLQNLRYLMLINTRTTDKNFDPLLRLTKLQTFNSSWNYPQAEFEKLKLLPNLNNSNVSYCLK